jgi:hypothetical protein
MLRNIFFVFYLIFLCCSNTVEAAHAAKPGLMLSPDSHQLILIFTDNQHKIQCYQRNNQYYPWKTIGKPFFYTLKKHQLSSNIQLRRYVFQNNDKQTLTIVDPNSNLLPNWSYNKVKNQIFSYFEDPLRQYNEEFLPDVKDSVVFMEQCKNPHDCIEMSKSDLKKITTWLNPTHKPILVLLSQMHYQNMKDQWRLPDEIYLTEVIS